MTFHPEIKLFKIVRATTPLLVDQQLLVDRRLVDQQLVDQLVDH